MKKTSPFVSASPFLLLILFFSVPSVPSVACAADRIRTSRGGKERRGRRERKGSGERRERRQRIHRRSGGTETNGEYKCEKAPRGCGGVN